MPFLTRNPSYYLPALQEETTDPLHIGLSLGENAAQSNDGDDQSDSTISAEESWSELATAIQQTSRSIRCLWIRIKNQAYDNGNDAAQLAALCVFGEGLIGATAPESLVLEGQGVEMDQLTGLREYLARNTTLRGIKLLRTNLDAPSSLMLNNFLVGNSSLRVLDLTANPRLDDGFVGAVLGAILQNGGCRLETLNIFEEFEGDLDANIGVTESGVDSIASFVSQTPSLLILRLRIREMGDGGLGQIANCIKRKDCNISRLEICGRFRDEGMMSIAEALRNNQSIRTINVGMYERLTDLGGQAILKVVQGEDESWQNKTASNHTLQNVYISDRAGLSMSKSILTKLQSITTVDPHRTLKNKAWNYMNNNIGDLSSIGLEAKLAPQLLSFVSCRGGVDSLFQFMHSRTNSSDLFSNPTPERSRLTPQMERVKQENKVLRALLKSESEASRSIQSENIHLRDLEEDEQHQRKTMARCLLLPLFKCFEMCKMFMELLAEKEPSQQRHI